MFVVDSRNRSYFGGMDNVVASKGVRVVTEGSHSRGHCEGGRRITSFLHNIIIKNNNKLRKEGAKSYALRQSLRRQYLEQQRTFHRKTPDEYHEGRKPQAGMLDDRPTRETFDGFSSLAKYQSMKYERDREINERVRRRRQQDVQDDAL